MSTTISVVIPTYNEADNLRLVLPRLWACYEVVVVDGGSADGTLEVVRELRPDAIIVRQSHTGKGNALADGFARATGSIIVMLDADGSADPAEIPRFVRALWSGADVAKGSRFMPGGASDDITPFRLLGNQFLTWAMNALYGTGHTDLCYGLNAFWRDMLEDVPDIQGRHLGFEIEALLNCRWALAGRNVIEVASHERERVHGASNLSAVRDGVRVLRTIVSERRAKRAPHAHYSEHALS